jgi:hypothetical protein
VYLGGIVGSMSQGQGVGVDTGVHLLEIDSWRRWCKGEVCSELEWCCVGVVAGQVEGVGVVVSAQLVLVCRLKRSSFFFLSHSPEMATKREL